MRLSGSIEGRYRGKCVSQVQISGWTGGEARDNHVQSIDIETAWLLALAPFRVHACRRNAARPRTWSFFVMVMEPMATISSVSHLTGNGSFHRSHSLLQMRPNDVPALPDINGFPY